MFAVVCGSILLPTHSITISKAIYFIIFCVKRHYCIYVTGKLKEKKMYKFIKIVLMAYANYK